MKHFLQIHVTRESTEVLKCRSVKNVTQEKYQTQTNLNVVSIMWRAYPFHFYMSNLWFHRAK